MRLNKFIAEQLAIGRRQADYFIEKGRVEVNGQKAELGQQINPTTDVVVCDGTILKAEVKLEYLLFHKPVGYVCSRKQQGDAPTIYSLLPEQYHHLKPVGRLDKDSSGLLLLTNDGDFTHRMTHPSFQKTKIYEVTLNKTLEPLHRQMINDHGIELPDGNSKLLLDRLIEGDDTKWQVTMHEGRNRQIRRTFEALGYTVTKLHRTTFGPYQIDDLASGAFSEIQAP